MWSPSNRCLLGRPLPSPLGRAVGLGVGGTDRASMALRETSGPLSAEVSPSGVGFGHRTCPSSTLWPLGKSVPDILLFSWGIAGFSRLVPCQPSAGELASRRRHYLRYGRAPVVTAPRAVFGRSHLPTGKSASPNPILSGLSHPVEGLGSGPSGGSTDTPAPCRRVPAGRPAMERRRRRRGLVSHTSPAFRCARHCQGRSPPPLRFGPTGDGACARRSSGGVGTGNVVLPFGRSIGPRRVEQGTE